MAILFIFILRNKIQVKQKGDPLKSTVWLSKQSVMQKEVSDSSVVLVGFER